MWTGLPDGFSVTAWVLAQRNQVSFAGNKWYKSSFKSVAVKIPRLHLWSTCEKLAFFDTVIFPPKRIFNFPLKRFKGHPHASLPVPPPLPVPSWAFCFPSTQDPRFPVLTESSPYKHRDGFFCLDHVDSLWIKRDFSEWVKQSTFPYVSPFFWKLLLIR